MRGRPITQQLQLGLPSGWNVSTALPTYQMALQYNDANQLTTTTTSTLNPTGTGFTTSQVYDNTTGILTGLSNNTTAIANVASLSYDAHALVNGLTFYTSAGNSSQLATEQFTYDENLRPSTATATWQSGSGASGQIFQQTRWYDVASNVVSLATTQASVPGQSGSGGSEVQNFCYDEQNRLVWASNTSAPPSAGNGTCGSQPQSSGLVGAGYTDSYLYTHLGQLWQGPLNGSGTATRYFYCASAPHQLSGLYSTDTTCSNKSNAIYKSSYDAWGNVTSRTYQGSSTTLAYDALDHMVKWSAGSGTNEWYVYDAAGNRVLRRSTSGGVTTLTTYAFGTEEHNYSGTGTLQSSTYYYSLAGRLIAELSGTTSSTSMLLTDALGSVLATFSNTVTSAALLGNQVYGPYGNQRYSKGTLGTNKGFTGQYNDPLTGLDYYNARYYDPVVGVFLSADTVQGNTKGMNPYAYVGGNPETWSDPTGKHVVCGDSCGSRGSGGPGPKPQPPQQKKTTSTGGSLVTGQNQNLALRLSLSAFRLYFSLAFQNTSKALQELLTMLNACGVPVPCDDATVQYLVVQFGLNDVNHGAFYNQLVQMLGGGKNFNAVVKYLGKAFNGLAALYYLFDGISSIKNGDIWNAIADGFQFVSSALNALSDIIASRLGLSEEFIAEWANFLGLVGLMMQAAATAKSILDSIASSGDNGGHNSHSGYRGGGGPPFPFSGGLIPSYWIDDATLSPVSGIPNVDM